MRTPLTADDPRHGTVNGYNNLRCRCDRCKEAARAWRIEHDFNAYHRDWNHRTGRNKPRETYLAEIAAKHGSEAKYRSGCRCEECRTVAARNRRARRHKAAVLTHNASGYKNGCRCETCREAHRLWQNEYRQRQRVTA